MEIRGVGAAGPCDSLGEGARTREHFWKRGLWEGRMKTRLPGCLGMLESGAL